MPDIFTTILQFIGSGGVIILAVTVMALAVIAGE